MSQRQRNSILMARTTQPINSFTSGGTLARKSSIIKCTVVRLLVEDLPDFIRLNINNRHWLSHQQQAPTTSPLLEAETITERFTMSRRLLHPAAAHLFTAI